MFKKDEIIRIGVRVRVVAVTDSQIPLLVVEDVLDSQKVLFKGMEHFDLRTQTQREEGYEIESHAIAFFVPVFGQEVNEFAKRFSQKDAIYLNPDSEILRSSCEFAVPQRKEKGVLKIECKKGYDLCGLNFFDLNMTPKKCSFVRQILSATDFEQEEYFLKEIKCRIKIATPIF